MAVKFDQAIFEDDRVTGRERWTNKLGGGGGGFVLLEDGDKTEIRVDMLARVIRDGRASGAAGGAMHLTVRATVTGVEIIGRLDGWYAMDDFLGAN